MEPSSFKNEPIEKDLSIIIPKYLRDKCSNYLLVEAYIEKILPVLKNPEYHYDGFDRELNEIFINSWKQDATNTIERIYKFLLDNDSALLNRNIQVEIAMIVFANELANTRLKALKWEIEDYEKLENKK